MSELQSKLYQNYPYKSYVFLIKIHPLFDEGVLFLHQGFFFPPTRGKRKGHPLISLKKCIKSRIFLRNEWMRPPFASSGTKKNPLMQASSNNEIDLGTLFAGARACGNNLTLFCG